MDILRSKLKSSVVPDAMVMRTVFDIIDSPPKFNADYRDKPSPLDVVSIELTLLSSSLLSNQTFVFEINENPSAIQMLEAWQDMCVAACKSW